MSRLDGQVGLITGGGRGIGEAIARELAGAGMRVAVTGRTESQVRSVAEAVGGLALIGDVSQQRDVERWVDETERELGPIDLLVNNAAIVGAPEPFWDHPPSEWWRVFEINVLGTFLCCHAVAGGMVERGRGRIVNLTSGASHLPQRDAAHFPFTVNENRAGSAQLPCRPRRSASWRIADRCAQRAQEA